MPGYAGGTAASDIARLRGMVAESGTATYTDNALGSVITRYPLPDNTGEFPYLTTGSANTAWTGTYDLAAAAADVWDNKAAAIAGNFDFTADGATFRKEQQTRNYERQARLWRSRRALGTHTMRAWPGGVPADVWIGNLAEQED